MAVTAAVWAPFLIRGWWFVFFPIVAHDGFVLLRVVPLTQSKALYLLAELSRVTV